MPATTDTDFARKFFRVTSTERKATLATMDTNEISITSLSFLNRGGSMTIVNSDAVGTVPLTVKGMAGQTANLTEWQDSTGTCLASVRAADGGIGTSTIFKPNGAGPYISLASGSSVIVYNSTAIANVPLIVKGMAGQTGNLQEWRDSAGTTVANVSQGGSVVAISGNIRLGTGATLGSNGVKILEIANAGTVPNTNPTGGGVVYVEAGALKYRGSSGTITTLAVA